MGEGTPRSEITPPDEWRYPQPNTVIEFLFKAVPNYMKQDFTLELITSVLEFLIDYYKCYDT
jgi:hypothetical protein